jgi:hypothetical protein
MQLPD